MTIEQSAVILYFCIGTASFLIFCTSKVYHWCRSYDKKEHLLYSFILAGILWPILYGALIGIALGNFLEYIYNKSSNLLDKLANFMIGD